MSEDDFDKLPESVKANARGDLRRQHDELQQQLREDILGPRGLGSDGKTLKNNKLFVMSGGSTPEAQARAKAEFDKRLADPGYVKLTDPVDFKLSKKTDQRPALLDLGTLIRRQQSAIRSEGTSEDNVDPKIALLRGLSEAAQAGLHVDADTLSLGDIKNSKTGALVMKMTPRTWNSSATSVGSTSCSMARPRMTTAYACSTKAT